MGAWRDLFERRYGFWRSLLDGAVARYLDCGIFESGFARIRCPDCAVEYLLAFSCKGGGLCLSCGAKHTAEFAFFLRDEVVADVGHAQWVFTYLPREGHDDIRAGPLDALDFLARLLAHVPDPRRHLVHSYGASSKFVRGKLKAPSQARLAEPPASPPPPPRRTRKFSVSAPVGSVAGEVAW